MMPHLSREVLPGLRERFRGEEGGRSHCTGQEGVSPLKLVTDPEVCDLDVSIFSHQQVGGFDVSVDDPLVMNCRGHMTDMMNPLRLDRDQGQS